MKKLAISVALCTLLGASLTSHASLTPSDDGKTIYDSDLNLTWLADANYAKTSGFHSTGQLNWGDAVAWAADLNFEGNGDWRLPTISEMDHLRSQELGGSTNNSIDESHNSNYDLFSNLHSYRYSSSEKYWTDLVDPADSTNAAAYSFSFGETFAEPKGIGYYAMAVSAVPEPETYAMLLAGLGLLGWKLRRA